MLDSLGLPGGMVVAMMSSELEALCQSSFERSSVRAAHHFQHRVLQRRRNSERGQRRTKRPDEHKLWTTVDDETADQLTLAGRDKAAGRDIG
jgi:hypothetical protein